MLGYQMPQRFNSADLRPPNAFFLVIFYQSAEEVEIILLVGSQLMSGHRIRYL